MSNKVWPKTMLRRFVYHRLFRVWDWPCGEQRVRTYFYRIRVPDTLWRWATE